MRALTHYICIFHFSILLPCNNEALAREGIDTFYIYRFRFYRYRCNNEALAREGIDTTQITTLVSRSSTCNNEALAREGIDTCALRPDLYAITA